MMSPMPAPRMSAGIIAIIAAGGTAITGVIGIAAAGEQHTIRRDPGIYAGVFVLREDFMLLAAAFANEIAAIADRALARE
jgi:hypothetical protein